jgi:hypothetical protein
MEIYVTNDVIVTILKLTIGYKIAVLLSAFTAQAKKNIALGNCFDNEVFDGG